MDTDFKVISNFNLFLNGFNTWLDNSCGFWTP